MLTSEYILNGGMDNALSALYPSPQIEQRHSEKGYFIYHSLPSLK